MSPTNRAARNDPNLELALTPEQRQQLTDAVVERVLAHLSTLADQPATGVPSNVEELCHALAEPPPERGAELDELLRPLFEQWIPTSFNAAGPGYLAYVAGGGLYAAALADFIACAVNRFTGVWNAAPLLVQLEANTLDWLRQWMGFPASTRGLLTTGGSMATFGAVVAAREKKLGTDLRLGTLYTSREAHACIVKAARLAGILPDRVRTVGVDRAMRMDVDELAKRIDADLEAGLRPFFVASSAGTVNAGVIDPIDAIGELCRARDLWHHVDGAYGGFFHIVEGLRPKLAGLSEADSLVLDPHKALFLPFGTGALLVRDGAALKHAHDWEAGYLPPLPDPVFFNPAQYGPELSRDYRGLRLWLPLKLHGIARFRDALEERHQLATKAHEALSACPHLELGPAPELTLFIYRMALPEASEHARDEATRHLLKRVAERGRVLLSGAEIDGRVYGRLNVLSFRTDEARVQDAVAHLSEEAEKIAKQGVGKG